jgi:hypothetical protein
MKLDFEGVEYLIVSELSALGLMDRSVCSHGDELQRFLRVECKTHCAFMLACSCGLP